MRLVTFATSAGPHAGLVLEGGIVDLTAWTGVPSVRAVLELRTETVLRHCGDDADVAFDAVQLLPPIPDPVHVIGVGLNTRSHADEVAEWRGTEPEVPEYPRLFLRSPVSQVGHGGALWVPRVSHRLDYEGELAVVIGRNARIPHRGDRARRGRRLRLLQRRQCARLPVTYQPVHGGEELSAHRRVRTVVGHA